MYIDLILDKTCDKEAITDIVSNLVKKHFEEKPELIEKVATECIKGAIKAQINTVLQSKEYRDFLRNKILEQLNIKEI